MSAEQCPCCQRLLQANETPEQTAARVDAPTYKECPCCNGLAERLRQQRGTGTGFTPLLLAEGDRQMVLLALAHLSIERPGWENALHVLALQIDDQRDGRAVMFDQFRELKGRTP